MSMTSAIRYLPMMALLLAVGCAAGPDFVRPAAPDVKSYTSEPLPARTASADIAGGEAQRFRQDSDVPEQWWTLFRSPALNALIEKALQANPDLQAAEAALRQAQENVYAQQGAYYPGVQANFTPTRQKVANNLQSPLNSQQNLFNLHTAQVLVSYSPDVFGLNRRQVESLQAQADFQRFQLQAAHLTLSSNIVVAVVQEAALRGQIKATEALAGFEHEQLDLLQRQVELGATAESAVIAQKATLAQTEASLPSLQKQLALQRDLLAALCGDFPSNEPSEKFELSSLQLPLDLPVSLPSRLVEQRPDIQAAEQQLHAASAQIGVAQANMLPQFTLAAGYGFTGTSLASLFGSVNNFWSLAGSVTQPILDGGILRHRKRAAVAAYDQAAAQYRSTVITAFQNVADTLRALEYDADAVKAALAAEQATKQSLDIARQQVALGDISHFAALSTELTYQQAVVNLVQAQAGRYADTAALFQALGGGWWNHADPASKGAAELPSGKR
jgi:NodT family efflux transporter outer membrane factor (OMF) lipoprotein